MATDLPMRIVDDIKTIVVPILTVESIKMVSEGPQGIPGPIGSLSTEVLDDIQDYRNLPNLTLLFENALI